MLPTQRTDVDLIGLAERILAILDRGSFTATYKYAVLLGLMDLCVEKTTRAGTAPTSVTTHELAEKVVALYWRHAQPIELGRERVLLKQNRPQRGKRAIPKIVLRIHEFRERHAPDPSATLMRAKIAAPAEWARLVREVEWKLVEMPLPRLQRIGDRENTFLFVIGWDERVRRSQFNSPREFDNSIRFVGEAADALVRLSGLLRPLVQREWVALVAEFNELPQARLERDLFAFARSSLEMLHAPLLELQSGNCFYCGKRVTSGEVDHFVPWARHPTNALENLVVADKGCNGRKSDHLAAARHLERWLERMERPEVVQIARDVSWESDPARVLGTARGIYVRLPAEAPLWLAGTTFAANDVGQTRRLLFSAN